MGLAGGGSRARKKARRAEGHHPRELFLRKQNIMNSDRERPARAATSIEEVKRRAQLCGSPFFDKKTLSFFGSRVLADVFPSAHPKITYFVTSEKRPRSDEPRRYTVRKQVGCRIKTAGTFQQFKTAAAAKRAAQSLASSSRLTAFRATR